MRWGFLPFNYATRLEQASLLEILLHYLSGFPPTQAPYLQTDNSSSLAKPEKLQASQNIVVAGSNFVKWKHSADIVSLRMINDKLLNEFR